MDYKTRERWFLGMEDVPSTGMPSARTSRPGDKAVPVWPLLQGPVQDFGELGGRCHLSMDGGRESPRPYAELLIPRLPHPKNVPVSGRNKQNLLNGVNGQHNAKNTCDVQSWEQHRVKVWVTVTESANLGGLFKQDVALNEHLHKNVQL